jgi:hypothetical protein
MSQQRIAESGTTTTSSVSRAHMEVQINQFCSSHTPVNECDYDAAGEMS